MTDSKKTNVASVAITAGIIGVAAGAVGMMLTDKKKREKVVDTVNQVKKWSDKTLEEFQKDSPLVKVSKKVNEGKALIEDQVDDVVDTASDELQGTPKHIN